MIDYASFINVMIIDLKAQLHNACITENCHLEISLSFRCHLYATAFKNEINKSLGAFAQ